MPKKRHKPEEIVAKLRQVDVLVQKIRQATFCAHRQRVTRTSFGPVVPARAGGRGRRFETPKSFANSRRQIIDQVRVIRGFSLEPG